MEILYFVVPLALVIAGLGVWAFVWGVKTGQFDDPVTPAHRMLVEDEVTPSPPKKS